MSTQPKPQKAHELLSDESKWTKGSFARTASGNATGAHSVGAVCWCLQGALRHCYEKFSDRAMAQYATAINAVVTSLPRVVDGNPIAVWNDDPSRTFAEVHNLLKTLDI